MRRRRRRWRTGGDDAGGGGLDAVGEATGLGVAVIRIQRQLRARSASDMTPSQSSALARVEQDGPLRLGALAELEGTTAATMSRVIDSLADRSLIERVPDPADGRASLVQLSPEGGALLHALRARYTEALRRALSDLSPADRKVIREAIPVMARLNDLLQSPERLRTGRHPQDRTGSVGHRGEVVGGRRGQAVDRRDPVPGSLPGGAGSAEQDAAGPLRRTHRPDR